MQFLCSMGKLLHGDATCKHCDIILFFVIALFFNLYQNIGFRVEELRDSTAHAEMICIREASNLLRSWRLSVSFPCFRFEVYFDIAANSYIIFKLPLTYQETISMYLECVWTCLLNLFPFCPACL